MCIPEALTGRWCVRRGLPSSRLVPVSLTASVRTKGEDWVHHRKELSPQDPATGREVMASGCVRGGSGWISGKMSLLEEWSGIGPGCPGQWGSPSLEGFKKRVDVALGDMV